MPVTYSGKRFRIDIWPVSNISFNLPCEINCWYSYSIDKSGSRVFPEELLNALVIVTTSPRGSTVLKA